MKTTTDLAWDRLATAAIATRDAWRSLIRQRGIPEPLRRLAEQESARLTTALKHPARREGEN
jgi:hypothetical protein